MYLKYFFTYETDLPRGVGYAVPGVAYWVWWLIVLAGVSVSLYLFKAKNPQIQKKAAIWIASILVSLELVRHFVLIITGNQTVYELPLHLCGMAGYLCLLHTLFGWQWLGQVLYSLCLPGAVAALLFPDWTTYPAIHFITIQAYLFHGMIVLYVLCMITNKTIKPRITEMWKPALFLCVTVPPIYFFNKYFDANYMFVNVPCPDSPLEWLAGFLGVPGYLAGYAVMVLFCMLLMYLPFIFIEKRSQNKKLTKL